MPSHESPRLERLFTLLLILPFFVPLPLTILVLFAANRSGFSGSLSHMVLNDGSPFVLPALQVPLLFSIEKADYQKLLANSFNNGFTGRSWLIRLCGEAYIRLFHSSATDDVVVGRRDNLYYNAPAFAFVDEYCVMRQPPDTLRPIVDNLRRWRDNCLSRGVGFAIVITPSKASIYPEDLPAPWRRRYDLRPRNYDQFVRLLQAEKIRYVDGHLLTLEAKKYALAPMFPDCGIHWGEYASLITTNAVLSELQSQGQPVQPIENAQIIVSESPSARDSDMLPFMKRLSSSKKYLVSTTIVPPCNVNEAQRPKLVMIGGSFLEAMIKQLSASHEFSEINLLFYYNWNKEKVDVEREVFPAQCLILEINEQKLVDPKHLQLFFEDTMYRLPASGLHER